MATKPHDYVDKWLSAPHATASADFILPATQMSKHINGTISSHMIMGRHLAIMLIIPSKHLSRWV